MNSDPIVEHLGLALCMFTLAVGVVLTFIERNRGR